MSDNNRTVDGLYHRAIVEHRAIRIVLATERAAKRVAADLGMLDCEVSRDGLTVTAAGHHDALAIIEKMFA